MSSQVDFIALLREKAPHISEQEAETFLKDVVGIVGGILQSKQETAIFLRDFAQVLEGVLHPRQSIKEMGFVLQEAVSFAIKVSSELIHPDKFDYTKTVFPNSKTPEGIRDEFYDRRHPPEGFRYPELGTKVVARCNYGHQDAFAVIQAGTKGVVKGNRMPGTHHEHHGDVGCCINFGVFEIVIPWDCVSAFEFLYPEAS